MSPEEVTLAPRSLPDQLRYWADLLDDLTPDHLGYLAAAIGVDMVHTQLMEKWNEQNPK